MNRRFLFLNESYSAVEIDSYANKKKSNVNIKRVIVYQLNEEMLKAGFEPGIFELNCRLSDLGRNW